jgi:uncharacterized protein YneR
MLFTNKDLELVERYGQLTAELNPLYKNGLFIGADLVREDGQDYIRHNFSRNLTIEVNGNHLDIVEREDDNLYIIIDTTEYRFFNNHGTVYKLEKDEDTLCLFDFTVSVNKSHTCKADVVIFKAPKYALYKIVTTSNRVSYMLINDGFVKVMSIERLLQHCSDNNIDLPDLSMANWTRLKR